VTVADINADMLGVGEMRAKERSIEGLAWQVEDAAALTFADRSFDAYTIAFGIRNVTDIPTALREAYRVLNRGGRFHCLEFSTSDWPGFAEAYEAYSSKVIPRIGKAVADDEASYRYEAFRQMIADAGFVRTGVEPMLGGLVAIHSGWKI
jgi:demethylmenaquinone methyltransferase/2-methoxy-6-polyprenyl-1,4-benzoquinol methylase